MDSSNQVGCAHVNAWNFSEAAVWHCGVRIDICIWKHCYNHMIGDWWFLLWPFWFWCKRDSSRSRNKLKVEGKWTASTHGSEAWAWPELGLSFTLITNHSAPHLLFVWARDSSSVDHLTFVIIVVMSSGRLLDNRIQFSRYRCIAEMEVLEDFPQRFPNGSHLAEKILRIVWGVFDETST